MMKTFPILWFHWKKWNSERENFTWTGDVDRFATEFPRNIMKMRNKLPIIASNITAVICANMEKCQCMAIEFGKLLCKMQHYKLFHLHSSISNFYCHWTALRGWTFELINVKCESGISKNVCRTGSNIKWLYCLFHDCLLFSDYLTGYACKPHLLLINYPDNVIY